MARDLFAERGIKIDAPRNSQPRDLFAEKGIKPPQKSMPTNSTQTGAPVGRSPFNMTPEGYEQFQNTLRTTGRETNPGFTQGAVNSLSGLANLIPGVNIPKANFAPNTQAARQGEMAGDIASYFAPGGILKLAKGVKPVGRAFQALESMPIRNAIAKLLGHTGEGAAFGASHAPEGEQGLEALKGGGAAGALNLLGKALHIPYLGNLLGGGVGYLAGQQVGHPYVGAQAGFASPNFLRYLMSGNKSSIPEEMLAGLNKQDVDRSLKAAKAIGIKLSPGQASGNPITAGIEAQPRKTVAGAREHLNQTMARENEQQNAIRNLLNKVYEPTHANESKISSAYQAANKINISPAAMQKIQSNPVMKDAFETVRSDPAFAHIPENNYEFLAEVDRQLYRDQQAALKNKPNSAHVIGNVKNQFNDFLKKNNPAYEEATKAFAPKAQRRNIESKINEDVQNEKVTGKDFYNKVLKNYKNYNELVRSLKNNPEARESLKNMRIAFKNTAKLPNVNTISEQESKGYTSPRDFISSTIKSIKEISGGHPDVNKIKYINSGEWEKDLDKMADIKDAKEYNKKLLNIVRKLGLAYGLDPISSDNLTKAISEKEDNK